ncbi:MAG TPA: hypothetical protein VEX60_14250 [Pyrinomonadaceae bacterium]|nr:hypothetical protein [Pyrinomonadaceae bacterium]
MLVREGEFDLADLDVGSEWVSMRFSPDGRYFAAGQRGLNFNAFGANTEMSALIFDRTSGTTLPAKGILKRLLAGRFAFIGGDRVVGVNAEDSRKSALVGFPGGEVIEQFPLSGSPDAVTRGNYLMIRPVGANPVALMDLATKKLFIANKQSAFDVYGDVFVSERANGELGVYRVETRELVSKVQMPRNPLGRLRASAVSPDFKWLAVSERNRGAVWNLEKGERVFHVRGFRGAYFGGDGALYTDFPKFEQTERTLARLDLATRDTAEHSRFSDNQVTMRGQFVVLTKPVKKEGSRRENVTLTVSDARTNQMFWTREFQKEAPRVFVDEENGTISLLWAVKSNHAKAQVKADPKLAARLAAMKEKEGDYFLQVVDARTGKDAGSLLIETGKGSFRISDLISAGDWVVVSDNANRVLLYSLSAGEQKGKFFGGHPAMSKASGLLAVENERGQIYIYDLATAEKRDQFTFADPVSLARFSEDGKRLFVLTAAQTAYVLDLAAGAQPR